MEAWHERQQVAPSGRVAVAHQAGMTLRSDLRVKPWDPRLGWRSTVAEAADAINRPHEDYPRRVVATARELERLSRRPLPATITGEMIRKVHAAVFADTDFAGSWKERDFSIGVDGQSRVTAVADLMARLEGRVPRERDQHAHAA